MLQHECNFSFAAPFYLKGSSSIRGEQMPTSWSLHHLLRACEDQWLSSMVVHSLLLSCLSFHSIYNQSIDNIILIGQIVKKKIIIIYTNMEAI